MTRAVKLLLLGVALVFLLLTLGAWYALNA